MRAYHTFILFSLACFVSYGCFHAGNFEAQDVRNIIVNHSTRQSVDSLLGNPSSIDSSSASKHTLYYRYDHGEQNPGTRTLWVKRKNLVIEFVNDTVNGYIFNNSIDQNSTDFNERLRDSIIEGTSNKASVRSLFGEPSGIIMLPTTLLSYPPMKEFHLTPPAKPRETWSYYYSLTTYLEFFGHTNEYKLLLVYFNSDGIVTNVFQTVYPKTSQSPFSPSTTIEYRLQESVCVSLTIYDVWGNIILTPIVDEYQEAGRHVIMPDVTLLSSGVYFYKLEAGQFSQVRKIIVMK